MTRKPLNLTKTLGSRIYSFCLQEKLCIVRRSRKSTGIELLHRRSEIERAYRHRTNFQRLKKGEDSMVATDGQFICKKVFEKNQVQINCMYVQ